MCPVWNGAKIVRLSVCWLVGFSGLPTFVVFKFVTLNHFYNYVILALVATSGSKTSCDFLFCLRHQFGHHVGPNVFFALHPWPQRLVETGTPDLERRRQQLLRARARLCLSLPANIGSAFGASGRIGRINVRTDVFFATLGLM